MAEQHQVQGFDNYFSKVKELQETEGKKSESSRRPIVVMFSGGTDPLTNKSWCPDCVVAKPVVEEVVNGDLAKDFIYIYCDVGDRTFWKNQSNAFRKDERTLLTGVPTLARLVKDNVTQKLVESQCANKSLIEMLFEN